MSVCMGLVAVFTIYVAVSFFIKNRMGRIPDSLYIKMELVSLVWDSVFFLTSVKLSCISVEGREQRIVGQNVSRTCIGL